MLALEATGAEYEPIAVDLRGERSELRAVSPVGKVPALATGGSVLTETVAIITWLARRFPEARLLPEEVDASAQAVSVMTWLTSTVHILRRQFMVPMAFGVGAEAQAELSRVAEPRYWAELKRIDHLIDDGHMTPAGVQRYALLFYHWGMIDSFPVGNLKHFTSLARRLVELPDVRLALERHYSPLLHAWA